MEDKERERLTHRRDELIKMASTPGWEILENWIKGKIKESKSITCVDTSSDDRLVMTFKLALSRLSVYNTVLEFVGKNTKTLKEGENG